MNTWEYLVVQVNCGEIVVINGVSTISGRRKDVAGPGVTDFLADKGLEGWELVSVDNKVMYFKRPLNPHTYGSENT